MQVIIIKECSNIDGDNFVSKKAFKKNYNKEIITASMVGLAGAN